MKDIKLKDKIAQGINDLFYIWKREFQTTFRDQGVLIFFILVPLGYPLLYSFIYDNEVVREVPAVVVDDSHSSLNRCVGKKHRFIIQQSAHVAIDAYLCLFSFGNIVAEIRRDINDAIRTPVL